MLLGEPARRLNSQGQTRHRVGGWAPVRVGVWGGHIYLRDGGVCHGDHTVDFKEQSGR